MKQKASSELKVIYGTFRQQRFFYGRGVKLSSWETAALYNLVPTLLQISLNDLISWIKVKVKVSLFVTW